MSSVTVPPNTSPTPPRPPTPGTRPLDPVAASRVPPQDLEAEMSLLGSMMIDRDSIGLVVQIIPRDESWRFYRSDHRLVYEVLVDIYEAGKPIDLIVVEDELRRRSQLDEVGGRNYLLDLCNSAPSSANAEYYAKIVRDKALLRQLIQCSVASTQAAYDAKEAAEVILDDAEKSLFAVTEQRITNKPVRIIEFLKQTFEQIQTREAGTLSGVPTGFKELDDCLGGFQNGDFIVIAARPSMGKTAIGLSLAEHIGIDERMATVFYSLEMSKLQIAQRMLCARGRADMHKMRSGMLSESEIVHLQLVCGDMQEGLIFVDDTPGMSVMEVRAKTRLLKKQHDIKIVFIDYLQLMTDRSAGRESRQQEVSSISRGLKALARELGIPVVALAQLNRKVEDRQGNRPRMSDLRESGAIEQDADVVMLLHREDYYIEQDINRLTEDEAQSNDGTEARNAHDRQRYLKARLEKVKGFAELIVAKQRNGPTGVVTLRFSPAFTRFDSAAPNYIAAEEAYTNDAYASNPEYYGQPDLSDPPDYPPDEAPF